MLNTINVFMGYCLVHKFAILLLVGTACFSKTLPEKIIRNFIFRNGRTQEIWNVIKVKAREQDSATELVVPSVTIIGTNFSDKSDQTSSQTSLILLGGCQFTNYNLAIKISDQNVYTVIFDSGSPSLALASTVCDSTCSSVPGPFSTNGPGYTGYTDTLSYGSAQLEGYVFTEDVSLSTTLPTVTMNLLAVSSQKGLLNKDSCLIDDLSNGDVSYTYQGILGFGPDNSATENYQTVVGLLGDAGVPEIFSTVLCDPGGYLWMGGYDQQVITAGPLYTPMYTDSSIYDGYLFQIGAVELGGQDLGFGSETVWLADTGTNFLSVSSQVAQNAAALLNGPIEQLTGTPNFFSTTNSYCIQGIDRTRIDQSLPTMEFIIPEVNGGSFTLSKPASRSYLVGHLLSDGTEVFCSNIISSTQSSSFTTFPNSLMNNIVIIWDQVGNQLGFAIAEDSLCSSLSPSPPKKTPKRTPKKTPKRTPKKTPKRTPKKTPKRTPKKTPKRTPKKTPKRTPKKTPKRTSKPKHK